MSTDDLARALASAGAAARPAAGGAYAAAADAVAAAERTKTLMSDVYYEIEQQVGAMEAGELAGGGDEPAVGRKAVLRCVRGVIKQATLRALS